MHNPAAPAPRRRRGHAGLAHPAVVVSALGALAIVLAACSSTPSTTATTTAPTTTAASGGGTTTTTAGSSSATVKSASTNKGTVLENSASMPLYTLAAGTTCTGACAQAWPLLTVPAGTTPKAGPGVTGTLATTMSGGSLVVTYNGKELYTFLSDSPGQVTGDGVAGFSVVKMTAATASVSTDATTTTTKASGGGYQY